MGACCVSHLSSCGHFACTLSGADLHFFIAADSRLVNPLARMLTRGGEAVVCDRCELWGPLGAAGSIGAQQGWTVRGFPTITLAIPLNHVSERYPCSPQLPPCRPSMGQAKQCVDHPQNIIAEGKRKKEKHPIFHSPCRGPVTRSCSGMWL